MFNDAADDVCSQRFMQKPLQQRQNLVLSHENQAGAETFPEKVIRPCCRSLEMPLQVRQPTQFVSLEWGLPCLLRHRGRDSVSFLISEMIDQQTAFAGGDLYEQYPFVLFQKSFQRSDVWVASDNQGIDCPGRQPENPI